MRNLLQGETFKVKVLLHGMWPEELREAVTEITGSTVAERAPANFSSSWDRRASCSTWELLHE